MNIQYKGIKSFNASELQELFLSVKWISGQHPEKLVAAMKILIPCFLRGLENGLLV